MDAKSEINRKLIWKMASDREPPVPSVPTLYYFLESPPCLTVIAVARFLDIELDLKPVDLWADEHKSKRFIKINPFKCVPAFWDSDGFKLSESRAICTYLIQTHKPDSALYPSGDLKKRATIDMFLQFDLGTFFRAISDVVYDAWSTGEINRKKVPRLEEVLATFDCLLAQNNTVFVAGDQLSVADISMHFIWRILELFTDIDISVYLAIHGWNLKIIEALKPINTDGLFDKAFHNLKEYTEQALRGVEHF